MSKTEKKSEVRTQKMMEARMALRRSRQRNRKYDNDDFETIFNDKTSRESFLDDRYMIDEESTDEAVDSDLG